jgi:FtsZ-interacting cell division protein ZipA
MTDLQVSLLVIGAIVIAAVMGYNWFQQWRLKRRLEEASASERADVHVREAAVDPRSPSRVEPQLFDPAPPASGPAEWPVVPPFEPLERADADTSALPTAPGFDPEIDFIVGIDGADPISPSALAELHTRAAACGRRFRIAGYDGEDWQEAGRLSGGRYAHLRMALQLVTRKGAVDAAALAAFCAAAQECAVRSGARAACPDIEGALKRARELDRFCAEVDVAIGVNVIAPEDARFTGPRIKSVAESLAFQLEPDGVFHYTDEARRTLFTLDNQESEPFLPERVKQITTGGVTLVLDVPRVADGAAALDIMLHRGRELAAGLGGTLVDDNRVPLTDRSVRAIREQLVSIHESMEARGTPPGSARALRLFS